LWAIFSEGYVNKGVLLELFMAESSSSADLSLFLITLFLASDTYTLSLLDDLDFLPLFIGFYSFSLLLLLADWVLVGLFWECTPTNEDLTLLVFLLEDLSFLV